MGLRGDGGEVFPGFPWSFANRENSTRYSKEMAPRTIDLLERCVVMPTCQKISDAFLDAVCRAIRKVDGCGNRDGNLKKRKNGS